MRHVALLAVVLVMSGCRSIFGPAPYDPTLPESSGGDRSGQGGGALVFPFRDIASVETGLQTLSRDYAAERNEIMREQLVFDVPLLGLAVAALVSGVYNGSKDLTLGLGLGSTAAGGARVYFDPQTRVSAYNGAALALACASSVAAELNAYETNDGGTGAQSKSRKLLDDLASNLAHVPALAADANVSAATKTTLLANAAAAQKAAADLAAAIATLDAAPSRLQVFAVQTIRNATAKV